MAFTTNVISNSTSPNSISALNLAGGIAVGGNNGIGGSGYLRLG